MSESLEKFFIPHTNFDRLSFRVKDNTKVISLSNESNSKRFAIYNYQVYVTKT